MPFYVVFTVKQGQLHKQIARQHFSQKKLWLGQRAWLTCENFALN